MIQGRPGDACSVDGCRGRLAVYTTRINFVLKHRVRYLHCNECGHKPDANKWIVPLEYAPAKLYCASGLPTSPSTAAIP